MHSLARLPQDLPLSSPPYQRVSRQAQREDSVVRIGAVPVGGAHFTVIAGPCAVESEEQLAATVEAVRSQGAHCLRGGAYKPRSSPYSFQGHGHEALLALREASLQSGLPVVSEILDPGEVERMEPLVDAFQIGARNMHNTALLRAMGRQSKTVILKRGLAATIEEFLLAAETIALHGNENIILCERGIRTFETATRNTLDLNAVAFIKQRSHLPVLVDPSHGTGLRELVAPLSRAAVAVGADGILVEVHPDPEKALSDGRQSLDPAGFAALMEGLRPFVLAAGKAL